MVSMMLKFWRTSHTSQIEIRVEEHECVVEQPRSENVKVDTFEIPSQRSSVNTEHFYFGNSSLQHSSIFQIVEATGPQQMVLRSHCKGMCMQKLPRPDLVQQNESGVRRSMISLQKPAKRTELSKIIDNNSQIMVFVESAE